MAERPGPAPLTIATSVGTFALVERVSYPNGATSSFYALGSCALIVDDGICEREPDEPPFDYGLITTRQNAYVARYERVFRLLASDVDDLERYLAPEVEYDGEPVAHIGDRAELMDASPLEMSFEQHFANVYGPDATRFLQREHCLVDVDGRTCFIDYLIDTRTGRFGIEENGISYHHPQLIGEMRYRRQLTKQNSCQLAGIRLFRFSTADLRFTDRFEDDIASLLGPTTDRFVDAGVTCERAFRLFEHQEGALEQMRANREQGIRCFLAVLPTASGKSRIVCEDLLRFAPTRSDFHALVLCPSKTIAADWRERVRRDLAPLEGRVRVATYAWANRHAREFAPDHFDYLVVDEAHHAVAPALRQTIQYFDPAFLVGLTATDQRPDRRSLESVFGSYKVSLTLEEAMEKGIVARARAYRIETNVNLSAVRVNGREYVSADLERTLRVSSRNELIVDVLARYFSDGAAGRLQGVVFCVNVAHAREMERLLNAAGLTARALSGQTRHPERVLDDFAAGRYRFLCSCQMISEGWDYPSLGILVMARPTLSRVLYLQQLGRGLRRTAVKDHVFVLDVVDEYQAHVAPCTLHALFHNAAYVPFGDVLRHDYAVGDLVEVNGIVERVERITEVDATSFAERYEGYLGVEQLARDLFVNTNTVGAWIRAGKVVPTVSFPFGARQVHLFSPDDVERIHQDLDIPHHDDSTIRADFLSFLERRDYTFSYKMPFMLSFLDRMDPLTGQAAIDDVLADYRAFYQGRLDRGLAVDRAGCPLDEARLADTRYLRRSMLTNPFEKFERKRFLYYSRDLGMLSMNLALLASLSQEDLRSVRRQLADDLAAYYRDL